MSGNLFFNSHRQNTSEEVFENILTRPGFRIERIVSTGQASPPGFWYEQENAEWVVLLSGKAELQFEDEPLPRQLIPGDWLDIEAHRRHRVNRTDPIHHTVWLAIHYHG